MDLSSPQTAEPSQTYSNANGTGSPIVHELDLVATPHASVSSFPSLNNHVAERISTPPQHLNGSSATTHEVYSFSDGNVTFQVENTKFKVHRFFFERDSAFFREIFSQHAAATAQNPATPDVISLDADQIRSIDFERFLGILYPKDFTAHSVDTVEEWTSVLDLSTKWSFRSLQTLAVSNLAHIASPIDTIVLGHKYNLSEWLPAAYQAVCERPSPLTQEEGARLGVEVVIIISQARHAIRKVHGLLPAPERSRIIEEAVGIRTASSSSSLNPAGRAGGFATGQKKAHPSWLPSAWSESTTYSEHVDHAEDLTPRRSLESVPFQTPGPVTPEPQSHESHDPESPLHEPPIYEASARAVSTTQATTSHPGSSDPGETVPTPHQNQTSTQHTAPFSHPNPSLHKAQEFSLSGMTRKRVPAMSLIEVPMNLAPTEPLQRSNSQRKLKKGKGKNWREIFGSESSHFNT